MGYTHYFKIKKKASKETFELFCNDAKKIVGYCDFELGINLANGLGEPNTNPEIDKNGVWLNGSDAQEPGKWTTTEDICIPWPSPTASLEVEKESPIANKTDGAWFAGTMVSQRVAPIDELTGKGKGSYETLSIENKKTAFAFCKTAYRPYDLVVTAILVALKHHFGDNVVVDSDGEQKDWMDAKFLCNNLFGYGLTFETEEI